MQSDPFFDSVLGRLAGGSQKSFQQAPMDAYRRGSDVWIHVDMPGVVPSDLEISVERNVLTVTGERSWPSEEGDQAYINERSQGRIRRQLHLGDGLDTEQVEADYRDGVLTLRIPVAEVAKPRKIEVRVGQLVEDAAELV